MTDRGRWIYGTVGAFDGAAVGDTAEWYGDDGGRDRKGEWCRWERRIAYWHSRWRSDGGVYKVECAGGGRARRYSKVRDDGYGITGGDSVDGGYGNDGGYSEDGVVTNTVGTDTR